MHKDKPVPLMVLLEAILGYRGVASKQAVMSILPVDMITDLFV